jgi:hypothetical protein
MHFRISSTPAFHRAEEMLDGVTPPVVQRYSEYWQSITPKSQDEILKRWLFAFCSIHTTWEANVRAYHAVSSVPAVELTSAERVGDLLRPTGCGLWRVRTQGISRFVASFLASPAGWRRRRSETVVAWRNRLVLGLMGLGMAKTSFVLEMLQPLRCRVVCIDTHVVQWYGLAVGSKLTPAVYQRIEEHWIQQCRRRRVPPAIARHILWDARQGRTLSSYWAHVFEKESS